MVFGILLGVPGTVCVIEIKEAKDVSLEFFAALIIWLLIWVPFLWYGRMKSRKNRHSDPPK